LQRQSRSEAGTAQELSDLLKEAVVRTRNLARGIFPVKLDEMGLVSALHEFAATVSRAFGLTCTFACDPPVSIDDSTAATHLYRIAQEAVNNSIKHGHARRVMILLSGDSDWITLAVADDGAGLPATFPATGDGMGVRIMEHRARMIGGTLQISRLERGTRVACSFRKRRGIVRALPAGEAAAA
jgi:signal transduction histidine kinase